MLVLLDDAQWFDQPSTSALSFAARRLAHEGIVMIFAVRAGERTYAGAGLPELRLVRLDDADAGAFLTEHRPELPVEARPASLRTQRAIPSRCSSCPPRSPPDCLCPAYRSAVLRLAPSGRGPGQRAFRDQIERRPEPPRTCCVAAADDIGDVVRVLAAARAFHAAAEDLEPAERAA